MYKLFTLIIIIATSWGVSSYAETINVAVLEFCPFVCDPAKEDGRPGFSIELERAVFERAGYQINFHLVPYIRSIKMTEVGEYDAVGFCNDESSEKNICSKESVGPMLQAFYVKKGTPWRYTGIESLEKIKVGVISGYDYTLLSEEFQAYLEKNRDNHDLVEYQYGKNVLHRIFQKILLGRIGTTNESVYVADYVAQKAGLLDKLEKAGTFEKVVWGRMCFSPKNPNSEKYVIILDEGIRQMKASGEMDRILNKYGLKEWD